MDSKELKSQSVPGAYPGSSSSSFPSPYPDYSENETLLNKSNNLDVEYDDNSRNGIKGTVSEDEDYVSGNEEFEMASDKPVLEGNVGEAVENGNSDASAVLEPISGVVLNEDDGVGEENRDAEGYEGTVGKDSKVVFAAADSKETKVNGVGSLGGKDELDSVNGLGKGYEEEVVENGGEIVDGNEGKLVVKEVERHEEVSEKEDRSVSLVSGDKLSEPQDKVVSEVVVSESEESQFSGTGDVNLTPKGDSVEGAIQIDVESGGETVDGYEGNLVVVEEVEMHEEESEKKGGGGLLINGDKLSEPQEKVVAEVAVVEPEESQISGTGDVNITRKGDSVVDAIQVDVVRPGVAVVGETEENEYLANESQEKEDAEVAVKPEGDDMDEEVSTRTVGIYQQSSEFADQNTGDIVKSKALQPESVQTNGEHASIHVHNDGLGDTAPEESKLTVPTVPKANHREIREVDDAMDEVHPQDSMSDRETDSMIFGGSDAAKKFIEELERESVGDSHTGAGSSLEQSQMVDGQIVTDSEEEGDIDDVGGGKELFDSDTLAALLKAATGADSDGGGITITSRDGSRLFSVERPAGLGSSLRPRPAPEPNHPNLFSPLTPAGGGESEDNLSEEEKNKLEKLQHIRVKFLRLVHRLGLSPEETMAAQVLHRLALLGGRQGTQTFSLDGAKRMALELEEGENDDLDFSVNVLVLGKSGVGKSATINSVFGEEKASTGAFVTGTASVNKISGFINGVKVQVVDTPGLKSSVAEQGFNRWVLSSVKKFTKKSPLDVVLYVDRLDAQSRDLNDLPLLKTVTNSLGQSIWRSAIVTLTHAASAPPDGPSGTPLGYEVFVSQRSHVVQQSIGHAVGDLRMMSPSLMNPVSLVENHPSCRKNREGQKILPNGQSWRSHLLLLCYSMKILSEASSVSKPQDPFDHRKLFGFRARSPPLPYMLSSMLQSRPHPKLPSEQGADNADSDIDLDDLSDSDQEEDEYDQLPPFKPLTKAQIAKLNREQRRAYFEEYDYRVKLLQKKQWKEELKRMREIKKKGKDPAIDYGLIEDDADSGAAAPVAVPLPDMALPPSFDGDYPAYRYRFLEPTSQFLARPVLDSHGWDHDCGYDGVNLEHSLAIANRFPAAYTVQISKDKKDFSISLDSSISAKHGENMSSMAGFDVQPMGKQLAYAVRAETKFKILKKNKTAGGISVTFLGENVVPGVKVEDQITLGKQYALVGSAGAVRSQHDTAYGANFELQRRELDYPVGQVQSTLSMSIVKWRGDLALGFNGLAQFSIGRNSKVAFRAGINNKLSGQFTVRTSSSEHLSLALTAIVPTALSIYRKLCPSAGEKYSIY